VAPRDFATRLTRRAGRAGLIVSDELAADLAAYHTLLSRWNLKINLTSLADPDESIDRLLLEPLLAARHVAPGVRALMDVGSGGGSPAIPLKLALGSVQLTMVEAKTRKSAFLREAIRQLDLGDARVETARVEELLARPDLHEAFDALTMRAVRVEPRVLQTLQAFLRPGGQLLLFRGPTGPDRPLIVVPPLEWQNTHALVDASRSRLTVLVKRRIGQGVPRGTIRSEAQY
jgi:16S rRNA (guanine527-N7)-methyltransferase